MADHSNQIFAKSLSTGYHRGQAEHGAGFKTDNNLNKMQESDAQRRMAQEASLRGEINLLEVILLQQQKRVKKIAQQRVNNSRDCIILINEAKALNPETNAGSLKDETGEDRTRGFIFNNLLWFVEELNRTYERQKQVHGFLHEQVKFLKKENEDTTHKILQKSSRPGNVGWRKEERKTRFHRIKYRNGFYWLHEQIIIEINTLNIDHRYYM